ncbi:ATP-binding protein [Caulobacter sp. FWC2]|uniref:ATP-binding protein n=1 Tax=Caulobacter sp. FWC2 TaxID=69664 RepID=UPI000C1594A9|nr:ATP-binding protein [Caulobacter sp. FWC2]PIB93569.1 hybrid sensor histidine kinase/response regulator [Caulobacter sp. FWC2]
MRWLADTLADERLDEVGADIRRLGVSRLISGCLAAGVVGLGLGATAAVAWLAGFLFAEGLATLATRNFGRDRPVSRGDRAAFMLAAIPVNGSWAALASLLWLQGSDRLKIAAVAIWCGQLVFAQQYRHQPLALLIISGLMPVVSLIVFPFFFMAGADMATQATRWSLVLLIGVTLNVALRNRAAAQRMDALTRGLREERERALEAARAKSTFIAVTSHELRTPMNGLLGMAHALERSDLNPAQREQVALMLRSGDSLMQLLNDVLDMSRIETGRVELAPEAVDPRAIVAEVVDTWRDAAEFKSLSLFTDFSAEVPTWIFADPLRIRQILTNLVSNAVKFTTEGHVRVSVGAERAGEAWMLRFAVSDTGPGVPADAADRVFDSFTQADETISRSHGGAGLGLTISRALARQLGGDLDLRPAPVGACFVLSIRAEEAEAAAPPPALEAEDDETLDQIHVLMAEDNAVNQLVVRAMLEPTGLALTIVENGEEALKAMASGHYDCVLMDINMPVMDGITALEAIRQGRAGDPALPVIALTASAMAGDRERFLGMGFDDHLGKPVKPMDLIMAIVRAVNPDPPKEGLRAA